jgi:hypothetical protein
MYLCDHLTGRKIRPRFELAHLAAPENAHFHVASANVDGEYPPVVLWLHGREKIP